jgi:hypothetical protein
MIKTIYRLLLLAAAALSVATAVNADEVRELSWNDLIPSGEPAEQSVVPGPSGQSPGPGDDGLAESFEDAFEDNFDGDFGMMEFPSSPLGIVQELDKTVVKLPGFVVPLEVADEGAVSEFLLVPYFGACIHYPPPPGNQIVYVKMDKPVNVESIWDPVWVSGEIRTEGMSTELGSAGYSMTANRIEEYDY